MSDILNKPVKPLIPGRSQVARPVNHEPDTSVLPSLPPVSGSETVKQPVELPLPSVEAWPFEGKENASQAAPEASSGTPVLQPVTRERKKVELINPLAPPPLQPITDEAVTETVSEAAAVPPLQPLGQEPAEVVAQPVIDPASPPPLTPIGQESAPVPATIPALEITRRGPNSLVEIPSLEVKMRDIYGYVVLGGNPDEGITDLHGIYLPEKVNVLRGENLAQKMTILCVEKFNALPDTDIVEGRANGTMVARPLATVDGDRQVVVGVNVNGICDGENYVRYQFRVVRFKMNDLGNLVKLNTLP